MYGIKADGNGPWHYDAASGEAWLVQSVRDSEFLDYLESGDIMVGDHIALYTPYDSDETGRWSWVWFGEIMEWYKVTGKDYPILYIKPNTEFGLTKKLW